MRGDDLLEEAAVGTGDTERAHLLVDALVAGAQVKLTHIVVTILPRLILGVLYARTDNVLIPIVVHGIYNAILFAGHWIVAVNDIPVPS